MEVAETTPKPIGGGSTTLNGLAETIPNRFEGGFGHTYSPRASQPSHLGWLDHPYMAKGVVRGFEGSFDHPIWPLRVAKPLHGP